jgi:chorismate mutase
MLRCRGIRGATTVEKNTAEDILEATRELLDTLIRVNEIDSSEVASVLFTTTPDINAVFPAAAARDYGWETIPLMCSHEMNVPGALERVIRILIHYNTDKSKDDIRHIYMRRAIELRPEWAYEPEKVANR